MTDLKHGKFLELDRCPHCSKAPPSLEQKFLFDTNEHSQSERTQRWGVYVCASCGRPTMAGAAIVSTRNGPILTDVLWIYPSAPTLDEAIPERAMAYLQQARESLHSPAGSIMLSASAVDAMLKAKSLKEGSLFQRIEAAAKSNLITGDMARWAHDVRLDANDQRHADEASPLPLGEDASRVLDFAETLAEILFVLPARVIRGRKEATEEANRQHE